MRFILILLLISKLGFGQTRKGLEILISSKNIFNRGLVIDSIKSFSDINTGGNIYIKTFSNKKYHFYRDSIWGFKVDSNIYTYKPNFGWLKLEVMDGLNIYRSGSKYHFFSRTLDSRIYSLTMHHLRKVYKKNKNFISALKKEYSWLTWIPSDKDKKTGKYRIAEIYEQSLKN